MAFKKNIDWENGIYHPNPDDDRFLRPFPSEMNPIKSPLTSINFADISADVIRRIHSGLSRKFILGGDEIPYIFELDELSILITKHLIEKSLKLREVGEVR